MRNTTWQQIEPGQIVKFNYKSMDKPRGIQRVVLVIDPKYRYRKKSTGRIVEFLVGVQLDTLISQPINKRKFGSLIRQFGGLTEDDEDNAIEVGNLGEKVTKRDTQKVYNTLKRFLDKNKVFRTYYLRECRKARVFLLDSYRRFPKKDMQKIILENKIDETIKRLEDL